MDPNFGADEVAPNRSEGYNHQIRLSLPQNASVWTLLKQVSRPNSKLFTYAFPPQFKLEEALVAKKIHELAVSPGNPDDRDGTTRTKEKVKNREELLSLCSNCHNLPKPLYISYLIKYYNGNFWGVS